MVKHFKKFYAFLQFTHSAPKKKAAFMWNDKKRAPQSHRPGRNALLYAGTACRGSRPQRFFFTYSSSVMRF
ncbi:MAG: hypothetical protein EGS37_12660 [Ruthenibacterium lactatiformans]|nr:hypothetical protein [Ruthenibacterium lactatiformans]